MSGRTGALAVAALSVLGAATRFLPESWASTWALRVFASSVLISVVPGMLAVLAWRPRSSVNALPLAGISLGVSFAIVQAITVVVMTMHLPASVGLSMLTATCIAHLAVALRRRDNLEVQITVTDLALAGVFAVLAIFLYGAGSPLDQAEDRLHISLIQRLAYLRAPSADALYFSPGVVYMYPFPGTHYNVALMSLVGNLDVLFLYHKLRMFWGLAALVVFYGCARALFENARIAVASTVTAAAFVANGTFAKVPSLYWGQMAPFSHPADVAMGVLLPALILLALAYLKAESRRESRFYFVSAVALACTVIASHPREILQFLVYVTVFIAALWIMRGQRVLAVRGALLLVVVTAILVSYRLWYEALAQAFMSRGMVVAQYATVLDQRERLHGLLLEGSWSELFGRPLPFLEDYMPQFRMLFYGWNPVLLIASPFLAAVLRRQTAWLPAATIAVYSAIIAVPALAITFAYLTYFEAMFTPVRNVIFFLYLLAGVGFYVAAARLAAFGFATLSAGGVAVAVAAIGLFRWVGPTVAQAPRALLFAVLIMYVVLFAALRTTRTATNRLEWLEQPRRRWSLAFAIIIAIVMAGTWNADAAVVQRSWRNAAPTPDALLASLDCPVDGQFCPPPRQLIQFAREHMPADGIVAVDFLDAYQPSLFMPQQMSVWPGELQGAPDPERLFARYWKHLGRARAAGRDQPFFYAAETRDDRLAFIRDLGVTHVLVNPRLYATMKPVLDAERDVFASRYDDGKWAVYEVIR